MVSVESCVDFAVFLAEVVQEERPISSQTSAL